jgi:hypothetical protein
MCKQLFGFKKNCACGDLIAGRAGKKARSPGPFFPAARSALLVLLTLLTLFVAVPVLLTGLALLVCLALLLAGLLARLRLVLVLGLLIVLARLVVLVRHIVLQGVGCPQPLVNRCLPPSFREKAIVPKVSSALSGLCTAGRHAWFRGRNSALFSDPGVGV